MNVRDQGFGLNFNQGFGQGRFVAAGFLPAHPAAGGQHERGYKCKKR